MSDILEHILARRSVRKFTPEPVTTDEIQCLLRAAMAAPSASNRKPWEFVVLTDPEARQRLRNALPLGRYEAPLGIAVCGNLRRAYPWPLQDFWVEDCSAAMQNILLTATGLGLGSVWIGVHPVKPLEWAVRQALALPKHIVSLGVTWIGHPAEAKPPRTQYDEAAVHWQRFGEEKR